MRINIIVGVLVTAAVLGIAIWYLFTNQQQNIELVANEPLKEISYISRQVEPTSEFTENDLDSEVSVEKPSYLPDYEPPFSDEQIIEIAMSICTHAPPLAQFVKQPRITKEGDRICVIAPLGRNFRYDMEVLIDANSGYILDAWRFFPSVNIISEKNWDSKISDDEAVALAKKEIEGRVSYKTNLSIMVEHLRDNVIRIVFPDGTWHVDTGYFYPGGDFAAEVLIDANSSKVLRVSGG
jgi:hypothetical protein